MHNDRQRLGKPPHPSSRTQDILEALPAAVVELDTNRHILFWSKGAEKLFGWEAEEAVGRSCPLSTGPRGSVDLAKLARQAIAGAEVQSVEVSLPHRDGRPIQVNISLSVQSHADGHKTILAVMVDVSAKKHELDLLQERKAALRRDRKLLQLVLDNVPQGIFWKDRDSVYRGCNRVIARTNGLDSPEQIVGMRDGDLPFVKPAEAEFFVKKDREVMASGVAEFHIEEQLTLPDGRTIWLSTSKIPMRDESGNVVGILGSWEDVTARKESELALRRSEARLAASQRIAHLGSWEEDLSDVPRLSWSEEVYRIFGFEPGQVKVTRELFLSCVHPDDREPVRQAVASAIANRTQYAIEHRIIRRDGTERVVFEQSDIEYEPTSGRPLRMIGTVLDVTERHRAASERQQLEEQLRQVMKMEAVGRLAGGVAHDFNNMLTVINGYSDSLLGMFPTDDPRSEMLSEIRQAGERAATLTRQLLAFSRKQVLAPTILDLNEVTERAKNLFRRLIGEDIRLETRLATDLPRVRVDPGQLDQVLLNLVVNSRDAMPQGGSLQIITRRTELTTEDCLGFAECKPGIFAQLTVRDTGVGMTDDVRARIFEPFFTTKDVGKGTGLGLATVYGIVSQSGGKISVDSTPGIGSAFHIFLPAVPDLAPDSSPEAIHAPRRGSETILIVEDEEGVRRLTKLILQHLGYTVLEGRTGREGRAIIDTHGKIDMLIADVVMPDGGGRQLAEHFRLKRPGRPVLFVSGYTDDDVLRNGVVESADPFLQKPFSRTALARKVRELLDSHPSR